MSRSESVLDEALDSIGVAIETDARRVLQPRPEIERTFRLLAEYRVVPNFVFVPLRVTS